MGAEQVGGAALSSAWLPEESLAMMDRYEIDAALLSVPVPLQFGDRALARDVARSLNEFGAECVAASPERFGLLAVLPLPDVEGALAEIAYALDVLGADGVGLLSNHAGVYLGDPRLDPLFAELDRRGAVAHVHPTSAVSPVPGLEPSLLEFVFDTTRAAAGLVVSATLKRHPNLKLILSHAGGAVPFLHDRIVDRGPILARVRRASTAPPSPAELQHLLGEALAQARSMLTGLYYDTALSATPTVFGDLLELARPGHILLGTDFPMAQEVGMKMTIEGLQVLAGHDSLPAIEGENAKALFPRLASGR